MNPVATSQPSPRLRRVALGLWGIALFAWLLWLGLLAPDAPLRRQRTANWRVGTIPALRGRLLDQSGLPLAWSVRRFDLVWEPSADLGERQEDFRALVGCLSLDAQETWRTMQRADEPLVLATNLEPVAVACLSPIVADNARMRLRHHFERRRAADLVGVGAAIGQTRRFGQCEAGISGWEKHYDAQLRGQDGKYRVLVDGDGRWVLSTWEEIRPPTPGRDVYVPYTVSSPVTPATAMLE